MTVWVARPVPAQLTTKPRSPAFAAVRTSCSIVVRRSCVKSWRGVSVSSLPAYLLTVSQPEEPSVAGSGSGLLEYGKLEPSLSCQCSLDHHK